MTDVDLSYFDELFHYGTPRKSGRYPWGSGDNPYQRHASFLSTVDELKKKGLTEAAIAEHFGINSSKLRAAKAIAKAEKRAADQAEAYRLREEEQMSNVAIAARLGVSEPHVRNLLNPSAKDTQDILFTTADMLRDQMGEKAFLDIGSGVENHLGISDTKLKTAVAMLEAEGYQVHYIKVPQPNGQTETTVKVLAPPGTKTKDIYDRQGEIGTITEYSEDGGRTFLGIEPPVGVDPKRVSVRFAEDGGADMDGVIQLRRGVDDISLGDARYAQVRIKVGEDKYLKGMAMYSDDLPDGVDMIFNTNKKRAEVGDASGAMKSIKDDPDNPFGSIVRQRHFMDADGNRKLSAINIVGTEDPDGVRRPGEEGAWSTWSKTLSSQMLSKQPPSLAKQQLDLSFQLKKAEFDEIMSLTNPAVKRKLLESFADGADAASVHLKAAGLPRTANHVILPINSMKDTEIYAPNYKNGERVVLIRHPHGGIFEIPELTVNNKNREANAVMKNAKDAVGINSRVAQKLSGADFDGDTVLVIPQGSKRSIKSADSLKDLKGFDPQTAYPAYDGMRTMDGGRWNASKRKAEFAEGQKPSTRTKQTQMGEVSNLITDMTIRGASNSEIARAVKHSMVVIDAEKHSLNYKQSAKDNRITELKKKYQSRPGESGLGASTLISRASSELRVPERKPRSMRDGGPIDPKTGRKVYTPTGRTYVNKQGKTIVVPTKSTRMAETNDAFSLSSGRKIEAVYATHANRLKALANDARKAQYAVESRPYSPSAKAAYASEVSSLNAKLNAASKNKPLERQALLVANATIKLKRQSNPNLDQADLKKIKTQAINEARRRSGAQRVRIEITPKEWEAIQAGAITNNKLENILTRADLDTVKRYATPRTSKGMPPAKAAKARNMAAIGYTQAEIAEALGVSTSTLTDVLG